MHNGEIEKQVLISAIINKRSLSDVIKIGVDCFHTDLNRIIFNILDKLYNDNQDIDITILKDKLEGQGIANVENILADLYSIPPTVNLKYYIDKLIEMKNKRKLDDIIVYIKDYSPIKDFDEIKSEVTNRLIEMKSSDIIYDSSVFDISADDLIHQSTIFTGYNDLDSLLTGIYRQQLIVMGARTSVGKSALALQVAKNISRFNNVLFISLEMPIQELMWRLVASECSMTVNEIRTGKYSIEKKRDIELKLKGFKERFSGLHFADKTLTLSKIVSATRNFAETNDNAIVFIDYLQLISGMNSNIQRYVQIGEITRTLKNLAVDLGITIVLLSQLNRKSESREKPILSDLRESGNIEHDSDVVMLLHQSEEQDDHLDVIIAKNRNGAKGKIQLHFEKRFFRFYSLAKIQDNDIVNMNEMKFGE